jgi:hypothetical protein
MHPLDRNASPANDHVPARALANQAPPTPPQYGISADAWSALRTENGIRGGMATLLAGKGPSTHGRNTMTTRTVRLALARLAVIVGLAVMVAAGSLAFGEAPEVAAMPKYTCDQAIKLSEMYLATGQIFYGIGDYQKASYYYGKAAAYADYC